MGKQQFRATRPPAYPVDPTIAGFSPSPVDGHPGRCQGKGRHHGGQCKKWAITGRLFCQFHGGRQPLGRKPMAGRYAKHVSIGLRDKLNALASEPTDSRANISDEIDLQRTMTMRTLALFDKIVVEDATNAEGEGATVAQKAAITKLLADSLESTTRLVERMVNIEAKTKDGKIDVNAIDFIAQQFGAIIERCIDDEELKGRISDELDKIMIPKDGVNPAVSIDKPGD